MGLFRQAVILVAMIAAAIHNQIQIAEAYIPIGVCYGMQGDNLPASEDVIHLYYRYGIQRMRLYDLNPDALKALRGSHLPVTLGIKNEDLPNLAASQAAFAHWFSANIEPHLDDVVIQMISVGNVAIPGVYAQHVLPVMQSLQNILKEKGHADLKVSTAVSSAALATSYLPSRTAFKPEASSAMRGVLKFLSQQDTPLMINVHPYFVYAADPAHVRLDYAQFTATEPIVKDGNFSYVNLYDAIVDGFFWAMEKVGVSDVGVLISESGWPSAGNGNFTTIKLASTYNKNFLDHVLSYPGTPKRPHADIEAFIFAMFNENKKPAGAEQNFGLFYPDKSPVYPFF